MMFDTAVLDAMVVAYSKHHGPHGIREALMAVVNAWMTAVAQKRPQDRELICRCAERANHRFRQWMPQQWLDFFMEEWERAKTLPASTSVEEAEEAEDTIDVLLSDIRCGGWRVAAHNDYILEGEEYTSWLFTKPATDGGPDYVVRCGGNTDVEALKNGLATISSAEEWERSARDAALTEAALACRKERISGGSPSWNDAMEVCAEAVEALKRTPQRSEPT